ncbi:hypothetical protein [Streptomyces aidingensis]|uniref:Helix-turn-helix domain-containing protein n=1 Tax=Streptomyces aidingensis TaxID=910347 RepID=A0A1I1ENQ3_9ACTN|nr:hypothetical protein [Streptomyces aidingensis]SFB87118.1 hypothetical protein SAMN05421773_101329 [Streptomyces aidingensis]
MATAKVSAPASGLRHVRAKHTKNFTILLNQLLQRPGSAVTVGVAGYLLSLPEGTPVSVERLARHFAEGTTRIRRALNELEAEGYLARELVRAADGTVRTCYVVYHRPQAAATDAHVVPAPRTRRPPAKARAPEFPAPSAPPAPAPEPEGEAASERAPAVLVGLRDRDPRLYLSEREVRELAPAVDTWLLRGATPAQITRTLTAGLPQPLTHRPARLLAFRLREFLPPPLPAADPPPVLPAPPPPLRTCTGCHEVMLRSATQTRCRACRGEPWPGGQALRD